MKIVQVINTMISNEKLISNVIKIDREYFFLYNQKYKWSIVKVDSTNTEDYFIHFYPNDDMNIQQLAAFNEWDRYSYITYKTSDLKTTEAIESFRELYHIVSNKVFGIDEIFDDIIKGS